MGTTTTAGTVLITYTQIGSQVDDGDTVLYTALCGPGGTTWTITGTIDPKYLPKS